MADIRIKDLTTLESASLTGDVFVIDGTTGTRKLSAFSPTFGGNATVTGTLTGNTSVNSPQLVISDNSLGLTGGAGFYKKEADTVALGVMTSNTLRAWIRTTDARWFYQSGTPVTIQDTTVSTSTSSGALVVGNGTSGGLGVGGSIYAGDNINSVNPQGQIQILGTGNTTGVKVINMLRSDGGDACSFGLTGTAYNGVFLAGGLGNNEAYIYNAAPLRVFIGTAATNRFDFTASQFKINPTTISNSTSSGALVVSGGVGVAGAIYAGGNIVLSPASAAASGEAGNLRIADSSNTNRKLFFGLDNTVSPNGVGYIQSTLTGTTTIPLQLQPLGGALTIGSSPSTTDSLVSATAAGTSGTTKVLAHLENNFSTAALNNAAQLRFKVFNNSVGDGEIAAINGISDSVTPGARTTALSFLTGQQTVGVVERMRISGAGTVSLSGGLLTISKSGAGSTLEVNADSGYDSKISLQRAATNRWTIECDSSDTLRFKSLGSTQIVAVTSSNLTFSGDLLFFANSTYDIGTTANRVRQIFVRDIYSTFYTPASATDTGTAGRICYDSNYIYICTATNTWKRAAISTW